MDYAIQIINHDSAISFTFVIDSKFVIDGSIDIITTLKAHKMDANEFFIKGNMIVFGTLKNEKFEPLQEFKKGV